MKKLIMRPAIAMIELIFALTVMGIVMLSIPNLLGMAANSSYTSLQQEAIATASSDISLLLSREWDEQNTIQEEGTAILPVTGGDGDLRIRSGIAIRSMKTLLGEEPFDATAPDDLGQDGINNDPNGDDDIDDVSDDLIVLTEAVGNSKTGNIDNTIEIATVVYYMSDAEGDIAQEWDGSTEITFNLLNPAIITDSTNIKFVSTRLTSDTGMEEMNKDINLFAFSCNIGGFQLERRELD